MFQEIHVSVSFLQHTLTKKDTGIVSGDYNSTKLVFHFEENLPSGSKVRFKMSNPQGDVVLLKELENLEKPEIILAGYDENGQVYSLFEEVGLYPFELVWFDEDSKLTSAPGWLTVSQRQVSVEQEGGGAYLPLLDKILLKLGEQGGAVDQTYNPESVNAQSGIALAEILFPLKTFTVNALQSVVDGGLLIEHIPSLGGDKKPLEARLTQIEISTENPPIDFSLFALVDQISGQRAPFNSDGSLSDFYVVSPTMHLILDANNTHEDLFSLAANSNLSITVPIDRLTALETALGTATQTLATLVDPAEV